MRFVVMFSVFLFPIHARVAVANLGSYNVAESYRSAIFGGKSEMEILLALAGIAGAALLLAPSSPLPSEADYKKALDKLKSTPEDPDANTVVGKYLAFVSGDYDSAMSYLAKSLDQTLRTLAEHERAPLYTDSGPKKIGMGDEWVVAAKKFPALFRIFYDRAAQWYTKAWPDLDALWKTKAREQGVKLAAARPPGGVRKGLPGGWRSDMGAPVLDGTIARIGSYSIRMPGNPKTETFLRSDPIQLTGKTIEYSAWVRSDGTDSPNDEIALNFFDKNGRFIGASDVKAPMDNPFWSYVSGKAEAIPDAAFVSVIAAVRSGKGSFWVDDLSLKIDGKEVLKNSSFEDR